MHTNCIKIATPVSHLFKNRKVGKKLEGLSDCLEYRDHSPKWDSDASALFHSDFNLVAPFNAGEISALYQRLSKINNLELITLHVPSCYTELKKIDYGYVPCGRLMPKEEMIRNAVINIKRLRRGKFKNAVFCIENNNYFPTGGHEIVSDPLFLIELMKKTKTKFTFDISHAKISFINGGFSFERYLEDDFMKRTIQVHVSKHKIVNGIAFDAHEPPVDRIWGIINRIVAKAPGLKYLTIEYYKNPKSLSLILEYLRRRILVINAY